MRVKHYQLQQGLEDKILRTAKLDNSISTPRSTIQFEKTNESVGQLSYTDIVQNEDLYIKVKKRKKVAGHGGLRL